MIDCNMSGQQPVRVFDDVDDPILENSHQGTH